MGDQVSHLLEFLHLRIGVIQYYDVDGLRHIVVKEPQVLFNKVTDVIIRTFSCRALTTKEYLDLQKGILTVSVVRGVLGKEDLITCEELLKFLVHLRIITPYPFATAGEQEKRYFIPCVLNHVDESREVEQHTDVSPLYFQFQCSHCPKGLFGVLVTHLMTPGPGAEEDGIFFSLIEDKIFKDQVSFDVRSRYADQDEMCLKLLSSHIEVKFFPSQCESRDISVGEVCSNVRQVIETSILRSLDDLHHDRCKVEPKVSFMCKYCSELHEVKKGREYFKLLCKRSRSNRLPDQARCWYNEGEK